MIDFGDDRVLPWLKKDREKHWTERGGWPAHWLKWGGEKEGDTVCFYRLRFQAEKREELEFFVSGDHRYRLRLDGELISSGPEAGDPNSYFYDRVRRTVSRGKHVLVAMVFDFKELPSYAHLSLRPGFLLAETDPANRDRFNTGFAPWERLASDAMEWASFIMLYPAVRFHAARWQREAPAGGGREWKKAEKAEQAFFAGIRNEHGPERLMREASLPPRLDDPDTVGTEKVLLCDPERKPVTPLSGREAETRRWLELFNGGAPVAIPAGSRLRIIGVMDQYYCVYPVLQTSGGRGAEISLAFAEACHIKESWRDGDAKGNREEFAGKYFRRCYEESDVFYPDGGETEFFTPHWRSGRIFELVIRTGGEELTVRKLELRETRYPLEARTTLSCDDEALNAILPMCWRTLQMCTHETFMDCPYYEQLMYAGDSRLEALVTMAGTADDRMVRKMLQTFALSQTASGFLQSRYPCRVTQIIPPFSLMWIGALHDFAMMRYDRKFVHSLMGCVWKIVSAFENRLNDRGLLEFGQGWNFMDWTPEWESGTPPGAEYGVSPVLNLLYAYALGLAAELGVCTGYAEMGEFCRRRGKTVAGLVAERYFDAERGLIAENAERTQFSEHSQCLAILGGMMPPEVDAALRENLFAGREKLVECTIYFSHYYFETCRLVRRADAFFRRLHLWSDNIRLGLKTLMERPEPSRSDCHAWSSHPRYHFAATLGGIRPAAPGFSRVEIAPMPGPLRRLSAQMIHPRGLIEVEYDIADGVLHAVIRLPEGVSGTFRYGDLQTALNGGCNELRIKCG